MLAQWGIDQAQKDKRDIRFSATPVGLKLYLSLGFEEVGSGTIMDEEAYVMIMRTASN